MIDHRNLLKKYMDEVYSMRGTTLLDSYFFDKKKFSEEELKELTAIAEDIKVNGVD
jgi:hypothetical protein